MSYETILEQIKDLPEECLDEISDFIDFVVYRHEKQNEKSEENRLGSLHPQCSKPCR